MTQPCAVCGADAEYAASVMDVETDDDGRPRFRYRWEYRCMEHGPEVAPRPNYEVNDANPADSRYIGSAIGGPWRNDDDA